MMVCPPPALGYIRDDFNVANAATLGSNYRIDSGTNSCQILSDAAESASYANFSNTETGAWDTWNVNSGVTQLLSDNYHIRAQLKATTLSQAMNNYTCIGLAIPNTYSSSTYSVWFVYCLTAANGMGIVTQQNAPVSPYQVTGTGQSIRWSTTSFTPSTTALIELERRKNVFTAFVNGSSVGSWTDSGNLVGTGITQRSAGIMIEGNNPNFTAYGAPAIDWWDAWDLAA